MTPGNDSENHTNHENSINSDEETKVGVVSTSRTSENTECEEQHVSSNEKRGTNIRKSIEMRVAQEN